MWVKNEGLIYFSFIVFYIIFFQKFEKKLFSLVLYLSLIFLKIILINKISSTDFMNIISFKIPLEDLFFRIFLVTKYFMIGMLKYPIWILLLVNLLLIKIKKEEFYIIYLCMFSLIIV